MKNEYQNKNPRKHKTLNFRSYLKKHIKKLRYLDKTKRDYFVISIFVAVFCLFVGGTHAYFYFSKHMEAATITIAKLKYTLTSNNTDFQNNSIAVNSGETLVLNMDLKSLNNQNTKYSLDAFSDSDEVNVYYAGNREQNVVGEIAGLNSVINMRVVIQNTSDNVQTVTFKLNGGYLQNTIDSNITNGYASTLMAVTSKYNDKMWKHKNDITKVVFENALIPKADAKYTYDISSLGEGGIMCYLVPNQNDSTKFTAYIQGRNVVTANEDSSNLFYSFKALESIEGLGYLDTSNAINMQNMFYNCNKVTSSPT